MFQAGSGKADITPPVGLPLSGFAVRRDRPSIAIADPLQVKALVLAQDEERCLLLSYDLLGFDFDLDARLRARLGELFPMGQILLTTTHTHSAPPTMPISGETRVPEAYIQKILAASTTAVTQALENLAEGELFHAATVMQGINLNRRQNYHLDKPAEQFDLDPILDFFTLRTPAGKTLASFMRFSCHAVTMITQLISADYPGELTRRLEEITDAPCLFLEGTAGDSNPTTHGSDHAAMLGFVDAFMTQLADLPARLQLVPVEKLQVAAREFLLPFAPLPARADVLEIITRNERILAGDTTSPDLQPLIQEYRGWVAASDSEPLAAIQHWAGVFREAALRTLSAVDAPQPPAGAPFRIAGLALGPFTFIFLSGEILTPVGRHIQALRPGSQVKVISYLSPIVGYIADAQDVDLGGYELDSAWMWYRMPAPFHRDIEQTILPHVLILLKELNPEKI